MGKENEKTKVAIISRESNEKTLDVSMLEQELLRRGVCVKVLSKLLTKERSVVNALGYIGQVIRQQGEIMNADVVVLDTYCIPASMLPHRKETKIVQIWHALGAVKKFGWQTVGKPDGTSEKTARLMHMHEGYDYVTCASDVTAEYFAEAFRIAGNRVVKLGLPRIDYIRKVTHGEEAARAKDLILKRYPKLAEEGKRIVLYAPTFRRGGMPDIKGLADALDPERYNLLVKLHPLYSSGGRVFRDNIIYDAEFSTYELLAAADLVVSDYSSLVIEETLSEKPLYLYVYDMDEYDKRTGLNMDFSEEAIGKYAFKDAEDLANALEDQYDYDALKAFGRKYIDVNGAWDGHGENAPGQNTCTVELANFIVKLAE